MEDIQLRDGGFGGWGRGVEGDGTNGVTTL